MANVELGGRPQRLVDASGQDGSGTISVSDSTSGNDITRGQFSGAISGNNAQYSNPAVRRSPMYMNQANYDSIKRQDLLEAQLQSKSRLRRSCYQFKHDMIVSPSHNFLTCTVAGFLFNLPIMGSIIIVYEKVGVKRSNPLSVSFFRLNFECLTYF